MNRTWVNGNRCKQEKDRRLAGSNFRIACQTSQVCLARLEAGAMSRQIYETYCAQMIGSINVGLSPGAPLRA